MLTTVIVVFLLLMIILLRTMKISCRRNGAQLQPGGVGYFPPLFSSQVSIKIDVGSDS